MLLSLALALLAYQSPIAWLNVEHRSPSWTPTRKVGAAPALPQASSYLLYVLATIKLFMILPVKVSMRSAQS
jgi:hypothetical protein